MSLMHKVLADSFSSIDDVNRAVKKVSERISELLDLQKKTEKQLATVSASFTFEIDVGDKKSPSIHLQPETFKVTNLKKMRENYAVVQELYETRNALDAMEAKIATSFKGKGSPEKALAELAKLKRQVDEGLGAAFSFLATLAQKHMPEKVANFTKTVAAILERSVVYESASLYSYIFEVEGDIAFSNYIRLVGLEDDKQKHFPEMFICCTYRSGKEPSMWIAIQHAFAPPSDDLLVKKVETPKDAVRALNLLLELDSFENSLGSLPMNVVLKPSSIKHDMFSYAGFIKEVEVDEHEIRFKLRPRARQDGMTDKIVAQLYKEMNSIQKRTNAKLRVSVRKDDKAGDTVQFYFVAQRNAPPVSAEDLSFLKDRFNVNQDTVNKVVKVINQGS